MNCPKCGHENSTEQLIKQLCSFLFHKTRAPKNLEKSIFSSLEYC